ncbi:MAG TPA: DUF2892 domain-containing protein [Gemmatimonadales bacterium]
MKNVGRVDSVLRVALGVALLGAAIAVSARPFLTIAAALIGLVFIGTGFTRFCPLYAVLGANTASKPRAL